jgi:hypothetical protein
VCLPIHSSSNDPLRCPSLSFSKDIADIGKRSQTLPQQFTNREAT